MVAEACLRGLFGWNKHLTGGHGRLFIDFQDNRQFSGPRTLAPEPTKADILPGGYVEAFGIPAAVLLRLAG
jgi:hypothetical protein